MYLKDNEIKVLIKKSFLNLYQKKGLNSIKVNDICSDSHIGRSTFYRYYKNITDIFNEIERKVMEDTDLIYREYNYIDMLSLPDNVPPPNFYEMYKYIAKNKEIFLCLLNDDPQSKFVMDSKKNIFKKLKQTLKKHINNEEKLVCICDMCTIHIMASCKLLLQYDNILTPKILALETKKYIVNIIDDINGKGETK